MISQLRRHGSGGEEGGSSSNSLTLAYGLSLSIELTQAFPQSIGKKNLWQSFLIMVTDCHDTPMRVHLMSLLTPELSMYTGKRGVVIFTHEYGQVNVSLLLPDHTWTAGEVLTEFETYLVNVLPHVAVDTRAVRTQLHTADVRATRARFRPRRFVPHASWLEHMRFDPDTLEVVCDKTKARVPGRVLTDVGAAMREEGLRPLAASWGTSTDPDVDAEVGQVEYWHKFPCSTVVALRNPRLASMPCISIPERLSLTEVLHTTTGSPLHSRTRQLIHALRPETLEESLAFLWMQEVPVDMRRLCAWRAKSKFGLSDELIATVGSTLTEAVSESCVISDLIMMGCLLDVTRTGISWQHTGQLFVEAIATFPDQTAWREWAWRSRFVYAILERVSVRVVQHMCESFAPMRQALTFWLYKRIGAWTHEEVQKAMLLDDDLPPISSKDPVDKVRGELQRLRLRASECEERALSHETARTDRPGSSVLDPSSRSSSSPPCCTKKKKAKKRRAKKSLPGECEGPDGVTDAPAACASVSEESCVQSDDEGVGTHHALAARLGARVGLPAELIGSGVFSDAGDADVVLTVPTDERARPSTDLLVVCNDEGRPTLSDWYARVAALLDLTPCYDVVSDERVAVLTGCFEGVKVDVQLWYGARPGGLVTRAEEETGRALSLARRLECEADALRRRHVQALHELCEAAGLKRHRLCRLPGVAVTVLGIALSCHLHDDDDWDPSKERRAMLERLRRVLAWEAPRVTLSSTLPTASAHEGRAVLPLRVSLEEETQCLSTRMTVCTTRHMLDTVAFALDGCVEPSGETFARWRAATMYVVAVVAPRKGDATVSRMLHAALSKLDGHPLLDSIFVEDDTTSSCLRVLATLRSDVDVARYGFREGEDRVEVAAEEGKKQTPSAPMAKVHRGRRWWPLALTPVRELASTFERGRGVATPRVVGPGWCVPSAPYVTVDVLARFDPQHWIHVGVD